VTRKVIIMARVNDMSTRPATATRMCPSPPTRSPTPPQPAGRPAPPSCTSTPAIPTPPPPAIRRYLEIIRKIRARSDILIDCTLGQNTIKGDEARSAHIPRMRERPQDRADMAAVDVGSTNIDVYDRDPKRFRTTDKTYLNTIGTCMYLAGEMDRAGVMPHLTCWAIPFLRAADALLDMGVF